MTDRRLADVSHTPPHAARCPVQRRYQRGPVALPDGGAFDPERAGEGAAAPRDAEADDETAADSAEDADEDPTLKDVDHTPPDGEGVNHVYRRGTER